MSALRYGLVALAVAGCGKAEPIVTSMRAADLDPATVADVDVTGVIDGERFTLQDAWFRIEHKEGRRRVDLILSDGKVARLCADADPEQARHVWFRFNGVDKAEPGTYRAEPGGDDATFAAHFEHHDEHGWHGRAGAAVVTIDSAIAAPTAAKIQEIKEADVTVVTGRLRACFGPGQDGCVSGAFRAQLCHTEFDLAGPYRERPAGQSELERQPYPGEVRP